jgi:hypothetical protein
MRVLLVGHCIIARLSLNLALRSLCRVPNILQVQFHEVPGTWATSFLYWQNPVPSPDIIFFLCGHQPDDPRPISEKLKKSFYVCVSPQSFVACIFYSISLI